MTGSLETDGGDDMKEKITSPIDGLMAGWSVRALAASLGIANSSLAYWVDGGLVIPDKKGRGKRGHTIGLSGLLETLTVRELRDAGFSLQKIRKAVEVLKASERVTRPLATLVVVARGDDIVVEYSDADETEKMLISALHSPGQRLMVFPIGAVYEHAVETMRADPPHSSRVAQVFVPDELNLVLTE